MIASLILAASLTGQLPANSGKLWTGTDWSNATVDISKPLHFNGGPVSADLNWEPSKQMFESAPVDIGLPNGKLVRLQFWAHPKFDLGQTWILYVQSISPLTHPYPTIDDSDYVFDSASSGPLVVRGSARYHSLPSLLRAGVTGYTLAQ